MSSYPISRRVAVEALGTALLLSVVVGSGIMGERLASGNAAIVLLANSVATGAALFVLITLFAPISGAHFNPVVSMIEAVFGGLPPRHAMLYIVVQFVGALIGVLIAHLMFELPLIQSSQHVRTGTAQWISEFVATFGLLSVILFSRKAAVTTVAASVACYISAAYWFTASTSFANPAVTFARSLTDTFSGIRMIDAPMFMVAQVIGAAVACAVFRWIKDEK